MRKDRQEQFIEDAVIRMRDLRDQEDCFSKEEFKGMLSVSFHGIAGVIPRKTSKERKKELISACAVILGSWGCFIAKGAASSGRVGRNSRSRNLLAATFRLRTERVAREVTLVTRITRLVFYPRPSGRAETFQLRLDLKVASTGLPGGRYS